MPIRACTPFSSRCAARLACVWQGYPAASGAEGEAAWRDVFMNHNLFEDLNEAWDDKKMTNAQVVELMGLMGSEDPYTWMEQQVLIQFFMAW